MVRIQEAAKSFSKRKHFVVAQILDKSGHPRTHLHVTETARTVVNDNSHPKTQKDAQT